MFKCSSDDLQTITEHLFTPFKKRFHLSVRLAGETRRAQMFRQQRDGWSHPRQEVWAKFHIAQYYPHASASTRERIIFRVRTNSLAETSNDMMIRKETVHPVTFPPLLLYYKVMAAVCVWVYGRICVSVYVMCKSIRRGIY